MEAVKVNAEPGKDRVMGGAGGAGGGQKLVRQNRLFDFSCQHGRA